MKRGFKGCSWIYNEKRVTLSNAAMNPVATPLTPATPRVQTWDIRMTHMTQCYNQLIGNQVNMISSLLKIDF